MEIGSFRDLAAFFLDITRSRRSDDEYQIALPERGGRGRDARNERAEQGNGRGRTGRGRGPQRGAENPPAEEIPEPPAEAPGDTTPTNPDPAPVQADTLQELAVLYVQQYEEGSGKDLSDEEFDARVKSVADTYDSLSNGKERLDAIVFANDVEA